MNEAVIAIGSNINPKKNIPLAIAVISSRTRLIKQSSFQETKPVGLKDQDNFFNGAVLISTKMRRSELEHWLHQIENSLGRVRSEEKNASRTIDLDLVVWNGVVIHPDFDKYDFVKNSVLELLPKIIL